jgi:tetratricopeptide (TPR) repeat protein
METDLLEANAFFRASTDLRGWARCQSLLAHTALMTGDAQKALSHCASALETHRALGDRAGEIECLANLAGIRRSRGEHRVALPLYEEALGIAKSIGHLESERRILLGLGCVQEALGSYDRAWLLWDRSLSIAEEMGDRHEQVRLLVLMAILARDDRWQESSQEVSDDYWARAMDAAMQGGSRRAEVRVLVNHGVVLRWAGETEQAKRALSEGLFLTLEHGTGEFAVPLALNLAEIFLEEGDAESAALLAGAVRDRGNAVFDEQLLHDSETAVAAAVRGALGKRAAEEAIGRGATMGLRAAAEVLVGRPQRL